MMPQEKLVQWKLDQMVSQQALLSRMYLVMRSQCLGAKTFFKWLQWIHDNTMLNCVHDINNGTHKYPMGILAHLNVVESIVNFINR